VASERSYRFKKLRPYFTTRCSLLTAHCFTASLLRSESTIEALQGKLDVLFRVGRRN